MSNQKTTLDISYTTFVRLIVVLVCLVLIYLLREIILILFLAIVVNAAVAPEVKWLQQRKVPRLLSIILIYTILIGIIVVIFWSLVPPMAEQILQLKSTFPNYFEVLSKYLEKVQTYAKSDLAKGIQENLGEISRGFGQAAGSLYQAVANVLSGVVSAVAIIVLSLYFTIQENALDKFVTSITPSRYRDYVLSLVQKLRNKMGAWFRGQLLLCLIVGIACTIGLAISGVKFSLALGALAGLAELIPYLGPIVAAIPAIFIAFVQKPYLALVVIVLYIVIQQLENHLLVPNVMRKVVGLNPIVVILAILIGGKLAGVLGAIIAVPVTTALSIVFRDLMERKKEDGFDFDVKE